MPAAAAAARLAGLTTPPLLPTAALEETGAAAVVAIFVFAVVKFVSFIFFRAGAGAFLALVVASGRKRDNDLVDGRKRFWCVRERQRERERVGERKGEEEGILVRSSTSTEK